MKKLSKAEKKYRKERAIELMQENNFIEFEKYIQNSYPWDFLGVSIEEWNELKTKFDQ
jgi:hypothetical protein